MHDQPAVARREQRKLRRYTRAGEITRVAGERVREDEVEAEYEHSDGDTDRRDHHDEDPPAETEPAQEIR